MIRSVGVLVAIAIGIGCRIPDHRETYAGDIEITIRNRGTVEADLYLRPDAERSNGRSWGRIAPDKDAKYKIKAGRYEVFVLAGRLRGSTGIDVQKHELVLITDDFSMRVPRGMTVVFLKDSARTPMPAAGGSSGGSCKANGAQTDDFNGGDCCSGTVREVAQGDHVQPAYYCCEFGAAGCGTNR